MILELAGKKRTLACVLSELTSSTIHAARGRDYARWLSRSKNGAAATAIYEAFDKKLRGIRWYRKNLRQPGQARKCRRWLIRRKLEPARRFTVSDMTLTRRGGEDLALVYLQLALYLAPNHPLALLSLMTSTGSVKKPAMAIRKFTSVCHGEFAAEAQCADSARDQSRRR